MIEFAPEAIDDLERIFDFNALGRTLDVARRQLARIRQVISLLDDQPLLGRRARSGSNLRELVISAGKTGFVAVYEHAPAERLIRVVAVRHQREAGYGDA